MPDTVRSRTALLALLADNTTQQISPQDMRDVLVSLHGVYGCIYVHAGATAQNITTTPAQLLAFATNGPSSGTTPDQASDQITVGSAGVYLMFSSVSATGESNTVFEYQFRVNDVDLSHHFRARYAGPGAYESASGMAIHACSADDVVTLYAVSDQAGGADVTVDDAMLIVWRIA